MIANRNLLIVTKHKKDTVIAPLFSKYFNCNYKIADHFDTDLLGTFCGEIERGSDPISTLRKKCILGLEDTNFDLAIASEGSFGSHPLMFFAPFSEEYMMLFDKKNNIEIFAKESTTHTNFAQKNISTIHELIDFAEKIKFPSHGLILKTSKPPYLIEKGITDIKKLKSVFVSFQNINEEVIVETDMRAMYNPTRMKIIKKLTQKLITKIKSTCDQCAYPGFDVEEIKKGLPCEVCKMPTESTLALIMRCKNCSYEKIKWFPHKKKFENPMYCHLCNP